jgi:hypothetical protein
MRPTPATNRGGPGARPRVTLREAHGEAERRSASSMSQHVEKVGIEPTTTTLARRVRFLSCHPQGRRPGSPRQEVAGSGPPPPNAKRRTASGDPEHQRPHPRRTGGAGRLCGSACRTKRFSTIELIICMHVRQQWRCLARAPGVEPGFRWFWRPAAYPLAHPYEVLR